MTNLKEDACTLHLLELVQRGHDLIAQVLKHSNEIPWCFRHDYDTVVQQQQNYYNSEGDSNHQSFWSSIRLKKKQSRGKPFLLRKPLSSYCTEDTEKNHTDTDSKDSSVQDAQQYQDISSILMDFEYLTSPETFDNYQHILPKDASKEDNIQDIQRRIIAKQQELEKKLVEEYQDVISSFVHLFHKIYKYYTDIDAFWKNVSTGKYIYHSVQSILEHNPRLRQLLCELLYLFGTVLILLDLYIPGIIRERFIIAHYRYCTTTITTTSMVTSEGTFDDICKVFQRSHLDALSSSSTSYSMSMGLFSSKNNHPDGHKVISPIVQSTSYMTRMPLDPKLVQGVINCIMDYDIYPIYTEAYPSYPHRSTRLTKQAQLLVVIVHFQPDILKSNSLFCRQMIDRFFSNRWRIPLYNGEILDIRDEWMDGRYPAAQSEIHQVLGNEQLSAILSKRTKCTLTTLQDLNRYMEQDPLSTDYVLDHFDDLLNLLRDANDTLQWEMLHRGTFTRVIDDETIVELIFATCCFDQMVLNAFRDVLQQRQELYMVRHSFMSEKINQLSNHFFGRESLSLVDKNDDIGTWFRKIGEEMKLLCWNPDNDVEDIQYFMDSIKEMTQIDIIDKNTHMKSIMMDIQKYILHMARLSGLQSNICETIETISDFSACRGCIEYFVPFFHFKVKAKPENTSHLSPFFIKCTTYLKSTLVPGIKTSGPSACFVRKVHTDALVAYVKEVLNVIPTTVFSSLGKMIEQNDSSLKELPNKIEVDALFNYGTLEERLRMAELTYELSTLTRGINDMEDLSIGTMKLEPQRLLEEGLRNELVRRISFAMHSILRFDINFDRSLKSHRIFCNRFQKACLKLEKNLDTLQRAMIWVQDFLNVKGIEIYYHELKRIIWHNVTIETGVLNHQQSLRIHNVTTIPSFPKSLDDPKAFTFLGRTVNAILKLVDYKYCVYSRIYNSWYRFDGEAVFDMKSIRIIRNAVGAQCMKGIVHLLEHQIDLELKNFYKFYEKAMVSYGATLEKFRDGATLEKSREWRIHGKGTSIYEVSLNRISKLMVPIQTFIFQIGQLQLIRKMCLDELFIGTRFESLDYMRIMNQLDNEVISPDVQTMHLQKCFSTPPALEGLPSLLVLFIIHQLPKTLYDEEFDAVRGKSDNCFDGGSVLVGISSILSQFHPIYAKVTIALLNQYIRVCYKEIDLNLNPAADYDFLKEYPELNVATKIWKELSVLCRDVSKDGVEWSMFDILLCS